MSKTNVQIVQEFIEEVYNKKRYDRAFEYCTEDYVLHIAPYIGIGADWDDRSGDKHVLVDVAPNGPAAGNLQIGDELVRVTDGQKTLGTFQELKEIAWGQGAMGTSITVTVNRGGTIMDVILTRGRVEGFDVVLSQSLDRWKDYILKYWPDSHAEIQKIFGDSDYVACYSINSGTHQGYRRSAFWADCSMYRLENGKIVESWGVEDSFSQMKQLGYQINEPVTETSA